VLGGTQLGVGIAAGLGIGMDVVIWAVCAFTVLFWIWLAAGIVAWARRPGNGIGPLLVVGSMAVFLGGMANMQVPVLDVISSIFATSVLAITVHLLHVPSGRLRGAASVATVDGVHPRDRRRPRDDPPRAGGGEGRGPWGR
jgi:hypothetical protein